MSTTAVFSTFCEANYFLGGANLISHIPHSPTDL
jgi:hypothetical protein